MSRLGLREGHEDNYPAGSVAVTGPDLALRYLCAVLGHGTGEAPPR